jgi:hypothetical protein
VSSSGRVAVAVAAAGRLSSAPARSLTARRRASSTPCTSPSFTSLCICSVRSRDRYRPAGGYITAVAVGRLHHGRCRCCWQASRARRIRSFATLRARHARRETNCSQRAPRAATSCKATSRGPCVACVAAELCTRHACAGYLTCARAVPLSRVCCGSTTPCSRSNGASSPRFVPSNNTVYPSTARGYTCDDPFDPLLCAHEVVTPK